MSDSGRTLGDNKPNLRDMLNEKVGTKGPLLDPITPPAVPSGIRTHSGSKYIRLIHSAFSACAEAIEVDVYCVLVAFNVTCPALAHCAKKLLCAGLRGKGDVLQDLKEARDALDRAIEIEQKRQGTSK